MSFESFIFAAGIIGQVIFQLRFIALWLSSEKKGQVVIPLSFWYLSILGSSVVLCYAVSVRDPVFILGQGASFVIYLRNLYVIASERGINKSSFFLPTTYLIVINLLMCVGLWHFTPVVERAGIETEYMLYYYIFGFMGQFFFFLRFFIQWLSSEKSRKSVIPTSFWYFSTLGSIFLLLYALMVNDLVFILGQLVCFFIYLRNLYFVQRERTRALAKC